ncbi:MAG: hypothetical protein JEY99_04430 [Spirochaetales bacterium]|nr:hypothetical protein [Spirochaetales bacterium]
MKKHIVILILILSIISCNKTKPEAPVEEEAFYPRENYEGIDSLFEDYACEVKHSRLTAELNSESIEAWDLIEPQVNAGLEYLEKEVNFGGKYILLPWGCGSDCQTGVIIDAETGDIFRLPTSERGLEYRKESLLLIVNPPSRAAGENIRPDYAYPAYYRWSENNEFILLHDTRE